LMCHRQEGQLRERNLAKRLRLTEREEHLQGLLAGRRELREPTGVVRGRTQWQQSRW
jgi:hypothetical protein